MSTLQLDLEQAEDLTQGGKLCLEKALLTYLESKEDLPILKDTPGLALYSLYFDQFTLVGLNSNLSCLKRNEALEEKLRCQMYKIRKDQVPPSSFSIKKYQDVNRLASLLNLNIVIYFVDTFVNPTICDIWHDFRNMKANPLPPQYFVISNHSRIKALTSSIDAHLPVLPFFAMETVPIFDRELVEPIFKLVDQNAAKPLQKCYGIEQLRDHNSTFSSTNFQSIIVVGYCKNMVFNLPTKQLFKRKKPSNCVFMRLTVLGKPIATRQDVMNAVIVCLFAGRVVSTLKDEYQDHVKNQISMGYTDIDKPEDDFYYESLPKMRSEEIKKAQEKFFKQQEVAKKKRIQKYRQGMAEFKEQFLNIHQSPVVSSNEEDNENPTENEQVEKEEKRRIGHICTCQICSENAHCFDKNMSNHGPEKLMKIQLDIRDLMKMLGIDSEENLLKIEQLCAMTIAAFDIESMTVTIDHYPPGGSNSNVAMGHTHLGGLAEHTTKIQKPIMIAHTDYLMPSEKPVRVFVLESNEESSIYSMMKAYWKFILERQVEIIAQKRLLVKPLLDFLKQYEDAHLLFMETKYSRPEALIYRKDGKKAFKFTVPGMLMEKLQKLIEEYVIFSFYGSGYDMPLLECYLLPYLFEKGHKPQIEKKGLKVNVIKTKHRIVFRDICKLLAPSTNLRNFGKLFDLEQKKAHFPFAMLSSVETLSVTSLPTDPTMWNSDISGPPITESDIQEAQHLFTNVGCSNLGDYLKHYLCLDVLILYKATQAWRKQLKDLVGIDFIESRKYTISSLSYLAGGKTSANLLRPGWFFPNNSQHYALLKEGMRG